MRADVPIKRIAGLAAFVPGNFEWPRILHPIGPLTRTAREAVDDIVGPMRNDDPQCR